MLDHYNNRPFEEGWLFSACCGTRYTTKPSKFARASRFILLGEGVLAEEAELPKHTINVVNTQNGPITVKVRHVW